MYEWFSNYWIDHSLNGQIHPCNFPTAFWTWTILHISTRCQCECRDLPKAHTVRETSWAGKKKTSSESCEEHCVSDLISVASPANRLRFHISALFYQPSFIINHSAHSSQRNRFTKNRIRLSDNTHTCHMRSFFSANNKMWLINT